MPAERVNPDGRHYSRGVVLARFLSADDVLRGRRDTLAEEEGLAGYTWASSGRAFPQAPTNSHRSRKRNRRAPSAVYISWE
jgi:hypothetical protein